MIQTLLAAGADVNACNRMQETPLHGAAHFAHEGSVKMLLKRGANPNVISLSKRIPLGTYVRLVSSLFGFVFSKSIQASPKRGCHLPTRTSLSLRCDTSNSLHVTAIVLIINNIRQRQQHYY